MISHGATILARVSQDALKSVTLKNAAGDSATVYTLGACVTSYVKGGVDQLMVRPDAKMDGSKPISGGIPHCFPQFGPGAIQQHGFARNLDWDVAEESDDKVVFKLSESDYTVRTTPRIPLFHTRPRPWRQPCTRRGSNLPATSQTAAPTLFHAGPRLLPSSTPQRPLIITCRWPPSCRPHATLMPPSCHPHAAQMDMWPNKFVATYTVTLAADALKTEFTVTNTDAKAWDFTAALHSYWSVSDIDTVKVSSPAFNGATFLDKMQSPPADVKSSSDVITFKVTFPHFPISLPHISPHLSSLRPAHTFPHARPLELSACQTETDSVYAGVSGDVVLADSKKSLTIQNSMHTHTHTHTRTHSLPALDTKSAPLFELPACVEPPPLHALLPRLLCSVCSSGVIAPPPLTHSPSVSSRAFVVHSPRVE